MNDCLRIVVADDEPDMREYLQKALRRMGHDVVGAAANGRDLIALAKQHAPDVILTDIKMPDMDGIDAAAAVYAERPVPIILISAYHDANLSARAQADHIMGYLVKPIKQADLAPTIILATRRFEQMQTPRKEIGAARNDTTAG